MQSVKNNQIPNYNQGDVNTAELVVNLTHKGAKMDLSTATSILLAFKRQDNTVVAQDETSGISVTDAIGGEITIELNGETRAIVGTVTVQAYITYPGDQVLVSEIFTFTVEETLLSGSVQTSLNTYQFLLLLNVLSSVDLLPTPSETYRKEIYYVEGGTGEADAFYACKKLSDNTYDWVQIA